MTRRPHTVLMLVLGSLTAIGPFSIDMYLPAFPAIARTLQTDIAHVALSLTSYFIGISCGQLVYGPLLDRFGRKRPLIIGLVMYIVAAIGCAAARSIQALVVMRFVLALGACVGIVSARAIVRDLFPIEEVARVFSTLMLVLGISPIIAPTVGAYVAEAWSWRWVFIVLSAIACVILFGVLNSLPESRTGDRSTSLHPLRVLRSYKQVLVHPTFLVYATASAAASGGLFGYISDAPAVFMGGYGLSQREFAWVFGISACGVIGASQANRFVLRHYSSRGVSLIAVLGQTFVTMLMVIASAVGISFVPFAMLIILYLICLGFLSPNTTAIAMEPFVSNAGTASALMGSFQMAAGASSSALISVLHDGTARPMATLLLFFSLISLVFQIANRRQLKLGRNADAPH